ncbi:hypothetical protein A6CPBBH3_03880 [Alistipes communis]|nr:hypothetical protein A6CPBBH3_03880 [Alistipes communis]
MGIPFTVRRRYDSDTRQYPQPVAGAVIVPIGINKESEDPIIGTKGRQQIESGLFAWQFRRQRIATSDLINQPAYGRNRFSQRRKHLPGIGAHHIDLSERMQNGPEPATPFRLQGTLLKFFS